ncbi:MAG: tripartite tricarboxylate transporter permease [Syntrophaceae bacterium]|nr:tripartite tricarboxylate transporter permease [Syntrophaceae bacterium]
MGNFEYFFMGLMNSLTPPNLLAGFVGCVLGTLVGILPGIGPSATIALLLPISFTINPDTSLIMMIAVYCGAMYGGSLTAILVNVPGEASSVMTAVDGYQLAKSGRGGAALAIAAIGSFVGANISFIALTIMATPLMGLALKFGSAEYFSLMFMALSLSAALVGKSLLRGLISVVFGLMVGTIGTDLQSGIPRLTLGLPFLISGINFVVIIMGVFGIEEVIESVAVASKRQKRLSIKGTKLWPSRDELRISLPAILRSSFIGFFIGLLPGLGSTIASFTAYTVELRVSADKTKMGKGSIVGVAAPETANNASTGGALIPLLTFGIPGSGATAVMLAAFMMWGVKPGPLLFQKEPMVVWTVIGALYICNVMLLVLNLPLIPAFVKILDIPKRFLLPGILLFTIVGAYSMNNSIYDIYIALFFGVVGYLMKKIAMPVPPFILAIVLGDMLEQYFRQAMVISNGSLLIFLKQPMSLIMLIVSFGLIGIEAFNRRRKWQEELDTE